MTAATSSYEMSRNVLSLVWQRVRSPLIIAGVAALLLSPSWSTGIQPLLARTVTISLAGTLVFSIFEHWPKRLPGWLARWVLQVVSVGLIMPVATLAIYTLTTQAGAPAFWHDHERLNGFGSLTILGLLLAPWTALAALVRQKEALARHQALAFDLERSELERQALDARLNLLQAQVAPHFLFNTLANIQALVDAGSPRASQVLRSLTAYLRAAVPRLDERVTALGQELDMVEAYLALMHMRMPDRLQFRLDVDEGVRVLRCPPMTLLTLVENAVRHGIDPSEEGGSVEIHVQRHDGRCLLRVRDTGVGLGSASKGLGTGLSTLRERLKLSFGDAAQLRLSAVEPHGVCAEVDIPAQESQP